MRSHWRVLCLTLAALCACLALARAQTPRKGDEAREGGEGVRLYPVMVNFKTGFIDRTGKIVVEPQYDFETSFGDGLAIVRSGAGRAVEPEAVEATEPVGGVVAIPARGKGKMVVEVIGTSGKTVATLPPGRDYLSSYFSEGLATFSVRDEKRGRLYGYMDREGRVAVEPRFESASLFREGRAAVCVATGRCGFIDREGKFVVPPRYRDVRSFSEGLAGFRTRDGLVGYMDKDGEVVIAPQFAENASGSFSEGLAAVGFKDSDKRGYIDRLGHFRIQPEFQWAGPFSEGLAPVMSGHRLGYIDKTGRFVISPQFSFAEEFSEGLAGASTCGQAPTPTRADDGTPCAYGYIDRTGRFVVEEKFDLAMPFRDGIAHVYEKGARGYIDRVGNYVWKPSR